MAKRRRKAAKRLPVKNREKVLLRDFRTPGELREFSARVNRLDRELVGALKIIAEREMLNDGPTMYGFNQKLAKIKGEIESYKKRIRDTRAVSGDLKTKSRLGLLLNELKLKEMSFLRRFAIADREAIVKKVRRELFGRGSERLFADERAAFEKKRHKLKFELGVLKLAEKVHHLTFRIKRANFRKKVLGTKVDEKKLSADVRNRAKQKRELDRLVPILSDPWLKKVTATKRLALEE